MNTDHPPFDPPYFSARQTEEGVQYIETLADGSSRPVSASASTRSLIAAQGDQMPASRSAPVKEGSCLAANTAKQHQHDNKRAAVFLNVPFAEKDEAKALGAKWDATKKKWYVPDGKAMEAFSRWLA